MTSTPSDGRNPAPTWFLLPAVAVAVAIGLTWMRHANTSQASARCSELYHQAHTAADSATIDSTIPTRDGGATLSRSTCGMIRTNARWR